MHKGEEVHCSVGNTGNGALSSLTDLSVDDEEHTQLKGACHQRGINLS